MYQAIIQVTLTWKKNLGDILNTLNWRRSPRVPVRGPFPK